MDIAEKIDKRICVITDNDGNKERIEEIKKYNSTHELQRIFTDSDIKNFTWEVCLYMLNEGKLKEIIEVEQGSKYKFKGTDYSSEGLPHLGKMLNNKVDVAYQMVKEDYGWNIPKYVSEGMKWIR